MKKPTKRKAREINGKVDGIDLGAFTWDMVLCLTHWSLHSDDKECKRFGHVTANIPVCWGHGPGSGLRHGPPFLPRPKKGRGK